MARRHWVDVVSKTFMRSFQTTSTCWRCEYMLLSWEEIYSQKPQLATNHGKRQKSADAKRKHNILRCYKILQNAPFQYEFNSCWRQHKHEVSASRQSRCVIADTLQRRDNVESNGAWRGHNHNHALWLRGDADDSPTWDESSVGAGSSSRHVAWGSVRWPSEEHWGELVPEPRSASCKAERLTRFNRA